MEDVYKRKGLVKEKIDCMFSERTYGIMADYLKLDRLIMTSYFNKIKWAR